MAKDKGPDIKILKELIMESAEEATSKVDGVFDVLDIKADGDTDKKTVELNIYIDVTYGYKIPAVSWDVQNAVKIAVKNASGFNATRIDIHIQGVGKERKNK